MTDEKQIAQLICDFVHVQSTQLIPVDQLERLGPNLKMDAWFSPHVRAVVLELEKYMAGLVDHTIDIEEQWPADWWQAFKERWFPSWIKRWYPVVYRRLVIHETIYKAVCPHVELPDYGTHIKWLFEQQSKSECE